ncbi:MAG: hypothetical protein IT432_01260 [Phycisphaerales bacterium]|nr:hypothetical protein [Phycisphaerales bacterium]
MNARAGFTAVELLVCVGAMTAVGSISAVTFSRGTSEPPSEMIKEIQNEIRDMRSRLDRLDEKLERLQQEVHAAEQPQGAAAAMQRQIKDATQIRGIEQAMIIWAQNNGDRYPLPSEIDKGDRTVREKGMDKNTTSNIVSLLIFNGFISPELCLSPAECNANIEVDRDYEFNLPNAASERDKALWDPSFNADFTKGKGNFSYAHMQPHGNRLARWSSTFLSVEAQVGNRGPEITGVEPVNGRLTAKVKDPNTVTFLNHGPRESWEGNIAYADCHVDYVTTLLGDDPKAWDRYKGRAGPTFDCYFYDEPDDVNRRNIFMSIFTKAGPQDKDWTAIWD